MPTDSQKYREAEAKLPQELPSVYRQMVEQYKFRTHNKYGHGYVACEVPAEIVLAGWRPSADMHPSSRHAAENGRGKP